MLPRPRVFRHPTGPPSGAPGGPDQTRPWSSIASATFRKPAMFAPFT